MRHIKDICENIARNLDITLDNSADKDFFFNEIIKGEELSNPELICVVARSGVGKTTFALDLVMQQAINEDKNILIFSCEKSAEQIVAQLVMKLCGLNVCFLNREDAEKIQKISWALSFLKKLNICIESFEDKIDPSLSDIENTIERFGKAQLVMMDGMYCLWDECKPEKLAEQETKEAIRCLKGICKRNDLPIIITTYFSREKIKRMFMGEVSENVFLKNGVDILIALYRSVVGTTISNSTDFLLTDPKGRYYRDTLYYDTKNRRFQRNAD